MAGVLQACGLNFKDREASCEELTLWGWVWRASRGQALAGHKRRIPLAVVLLPPARGAGTLIPSAQRFVWAAKQPLGKAALGALFA